MGIGLLDPFVPPNNSYAVYNNINSKKKLFVFKDLGHEVGDKYYRYETLYTRDYFGLWWFGVEEVVKVVVVEKVKTVAAMNYPALAGLTMNYPTVIQL